MTTVTVTSSWTHAQWSLLKYIAGGGQVTVRRQGRRRVAEGGHYAATCENLDRLTDWGLVEVTQGRATATSDGHRVLQEYAAEMNA